MKRGGGKSFVSLDLKSGEQRYVALGSSELAPDEIYDRRWATELLDRVLLLTREEYERSNKTEQFEALKGTLTGEDSQDSYREIARKLDSTEGAIKVAAYRLRKRYAKLLKKEVAETLTEDEDVEDELRFLLSVFG